MRLTCSWRDAAGNSSKQPTAATCESVLLVAESGEDVAALTRLAVYLATAGATTREALDRLLPPQPPAPSEVPT